MLCVLPAVLLAQLTSSQIMDRVVEHITQSTAQKVQRLRCVKMKTTYDLATGKVKKIERYEVYGKNGIMMQKSQDANEPEEPLGIDLNDPTFADRFTVTLLGSTGDEYLIRLVAKKNAKPRPGEDSDETEMIKRLEGVAVIDAQGWYIRTLHGTVKPFRKFLVGKLNQFEVSIQQSQTDGMICTRRIEIIFRKSVFGFETDERQEILFQDFVFAPLP